MDQNARMKMAKLHGRVIAQEIMGTGQTIYLVPGPEMIQLLSSYEGEPDCLLQGSPITITQLRSPVPAGGAAIPEGIQVSGDVELAEQFCRILRQVEINLEAYLTPYTGSLIATEVGKMMDFAGYWFNHIVDTLNRDIQEHLQQEAAVLPTRHEIGRFSTSAEQLADRLEQLQSRVDTIKTNMKKPKGTPK